MDNKMTKPIKISFIGRAGRRLKKPKVPMTKPLKVAFVGRVPKDILRHTEGEEK